MAGEAGDDETDVTATIHAWPSPTSPTSSAPTPLTGPIALRWCSASARCHGRAATSGRAGSPPGCAAAGVGPQDRVAFLDKNGIEHFEVFFGAALANAVCVDVNWRLAAPEVEFIVNDAAAKVLVVGPDFVPVLDAIADALTTVSTILVIGGHAKHQDYDEWVAAHAAAGPARAERARRRRVPALLERHDRPAEGRDAVERQLLRAAAARRRHVGSRAGLREPRGDAAVPHRRRRVGRRPGMYEGATSVIVRDLDPAALVRLIPERGVTHAFLVPAVLQFMLMTPGVDDADFSSLETIVYGASPISEEVLATSVATFGARFWQAYGLTETTGAIVNLAPEDHDLEGPTATGCARAASPGPASSCASSTPTTGATCRPARSARSGCAGRR